VKEVNHPLEEEEEEEEEKKRASRTMNPQTHCGKNVE